MMSDQLPALAQEIVELAGERALHDLVEWRGGRMIYVPQRPLADSEIVRAIGLKPAQALAARFGGSNLTIPMCHHARQRTYRDAEIYSLHYDHGLSIDQLAERFGLHWVTVCRAVRRHADKNEPSPQNDLFE